MTHPTYRPVKTVEVVWPVNPDFQSCWNDADKRFYGSIAWPRPAGGPTSFFKVEGIFLPVNGDPAMVLAVMIPRDEMPAGAPAMRLAITSLIEVSTTVDGPMAVLPEQYGNPPIECDLNARQADWVRRHGVPQSLLDAMQKAAQDAGWQPLNPNEDGLPNAEIILVDPAPHFPK